MRGPRTVRLMLAAAAISAMTCGCDGSSSSSHPAASSSSTSARTSTPAPASSLSRSSHPAPVGPADPGSGSAGAAAGSGGDPAAPASCSKVLGCHPPKDRCDPVWIRALVAGVQLPSSPSLRVRACTGRWLVVDITAEARSCLSMGGDATLPGCGPTTRLRWFAASTGAGWQLTAAGGSKGCADVRRSLPAFPTALCRALPALSTG